MAKKDAATKYREALGQQLVSAKLPIDLDSIKDNIANRRIRALAGHSPVFFWNPDTMVTQAIAKGIDAERTRQHDLYLLDRGAHRIVAFWLRHPLRTSPSTDDEEAVLLDPAKEFVTRNSYNERGYIFRSIEASYKTGPSGKPEKYEIFEEIELWECDEDTFLPFKTDRMAKAAVLGDSKLWVAVKELLVEFWERMEVEAGRQGTVVLQDINALGMLPNMTQMSEEVQQAAKELEIKVEVLTRKRMRDVEFYGKPVLETAMVDKRKQLWKRLVHPRHRK